MPLPGTRVPPLLSNIAGCAPAPLLLRALALLLDGVLVSILAAMILSRVVWPLEIPDAAQVFQRQATLIYDAAKQAQASGQSFPEPKIDPDYLNALAITVQTIFLVLLAYFAISELVMGGSTLGKRVFHLRTAQFGSGGPARPLEILVRSITKTISLAAWIPLYVFGLPLLLLNLAPLFFNPLRRAGHDLMARTIVTADPLPPTVEAPDFADDAD
jgi:uncharacterized RDD family membrane protein YckC